MHPSLPTAGLASGGVLAAGAPGAGGVRGAMSAALAAGLPGGGAGDAGSQAAPPCYPGGGLGAHGGVHKSGAVGVGVGGVGALKWPEAHMECD